MQLREVSVKSILQCDKTSIFYFCFFWFLVVPSDPRSYRRVVWRVLCVWLVGNKKTAVGLSSPLPKLVLFHFILGVFAPSNSSIGRIPRVRFFECVFFIERPPGVPFQKIQFGNERGGR